MFLSSIDTPEFAPDVLASMAPFLRTVSAHQRPINISACLTACQRIQALNLETQHTDAGVLYAVWLQYPPRELKAPESLALRRTGINMNRPHAHPFA